MVYSCIIIYIVKHFGIEFIMDTWLSLVNNCVIIIKLQWLTDWCSDLCVCYVLLCASRVGTPSRTIAMALIMPYLHHSFILLFPGMLVNQYFTWYLCIGNIHIWLVFGNLYIYIYSVGHKVPVIPHQIHKSHSGYYLFMALITWIRCTRAISAIQCTGPFSDSTFSRAGLW